MIRQPFACIGLSFAATLFVLNLLPDFTPVAFAAAAVCCGLCLFVKSLPKRGGAAVFFLGAAAAAVLFAAVQQAMWEPALAMDRYAGMLSGTATGESDMDADKARCFSVIRTEQGVRVTIVTGEDCKLKPGDRVSFSGRLYAGQPWLGRAGRVFLTCWYPKNLLIRRTEPNWARDWPFYARRFLIERITQRVGGEEGTVAAAMATGEKEGLSNETYAAFKRAGIVHVIAVSGLHMNLIVLALYRLLRRLFFTKRRTCAVICLAAAWAYAAVADFTPSAVRACIMVSAFLGGVPFNRRVSPLNSLGLAAFLILLFNPYAICSASFELSFAATLGLLTLGRRVLAQNPFVRVSSTPLRRALTAVYEILAVTFSANVGCLPVFLFLGVDATAAFFVTNLLTFFAVAPALLSGLFTVLPGALGRLSAGLCRLCTGFILFVVKQVSRINWFSLLSVQAAIIAAVTGAACLLFYLLKQKKRNS